MAKYLLVSFLLFVSFIFSFDVLNEINIHPIPEEMTFEEYTDMNRRLTVGLVLSAVPYPGIIHSYIVLLTYFYIVLQAIDVWMGVCTAFVFAALVEFTFVNYMWRKQSLVAATKKSPNKNPGIKRIPQIDPSRRVSVTGTRKKTNWIFLSTGGETEISKTIKIPGSQESTKAYSDKI